VEATEKSGSVKEFQRVAGELRRRMADGTYQIGTYLPPQRELMEEFDVSRDTVQRALRELSGEGWIVSKQGSGSKVVQIQQIQPLAPRPRATPPLTLRTLMEEAFGKPEVTFDVFTLTAESLDAHLRVQVERIRSGEIAPERLALRMLVPDTRNPLPYPCVKGHPEDMRLQERLRAMSSRHMASLRSAFRDLRADRLVPSVELEVRRTPLVPAFKLYLINRDEALQGMYDIIEREIELEDGAVVTALDVLGMSTTLIHQKKDDDEHSPGSVFVARMQSWFDSVWKELSEELPTEGVSR
jgi:DNA-binding transcriptional regulator YhcF (GntR family)